MTDQLELRQSELIVYQGMPASKGIATGRLASSIEQGSPGSLNLHIWYKEFTQAGDILLATMTTPDIVPYIRRFAGIVTTKGGILCHAAIIAREFKIPAVVGVAALADTIWVLAGALVTVDGYSGKVTITETPLIELGAP